MVSALQDTATSQKPTEQDRYQDTTKRILACQKRNQHAAIAVAGRQRFAGAPLDRRDLNHPSKSRSRACEETGSDNRRTNGKTRQTRSPDVTADNPDLKTECR